MLIVLAIAALSVGVAVYSFPKRGNRATLEQAALEIAAVMRAAKFEALRTNGEAIFWFDLADRAYGGSAGRHALAPDIAVTMLGARGETALGKLGHVRFLASGQCTGATITLALGESSIAVTADWLTGAVLVGRLQ